MKPLLLQKKDNLMLGKVQEDKVVDKVGMKDYPMMMRIRLQLLQHTENKKKTYK
jgi:hypothetical protein